MRISLRSGIVQKLPVLLLFLITGCQQNDNSIQMEDLRIGNNLKSYGRTLIKRGYGLNKVIFPGAETDTVLIAVHGYKSTGYEWIYPLKKMAESGYQTFFYRWDWKLCPKTAVENLNTEIINYFSLMDPLPHIIIFGHSYGGVVTALLAAQEFEKLTLDFHAVAAPLSGFQGLDEMCPEFSELSLDQVNNLTQWRTVHAMDGAFRDIPIDPQILEIENSVVITLPDSTDGHRLGHNWSISWVIDKYFDEK